MKEAFEKVKQSSDRGFYYNAKSVTIVTRGGTKRTSKNVKLFIGGDGEAQFLSVTEGTGWPNIYRIRDLAVLKIR